MLHQYIPIPTYGEMLFFCSAAALAQLAVLMRYWGSTVLAARRRAGAGKGVSVIVPCRGGGPELEAAADAMAGQEYPAGAEFIFVVASASDPALARLQRVAAARPGARIKVLVSGAVPERCGEKGLNMLYGAAAASPETEILVFADSDILVPQGWLQELCRGLGDGGAAAVTAPAVFRAGQGFAGDLACAWSVLGAQYLDLASCVVGHSFAVKKSDFRGLGVEELWRRSLSDDLAFTRRLGKEGRKVRFAYGALPSAGEGPRFGELLRLTSKWMLYFKYYYPQVWLLGAGLTAFKLFTFGWSALRGEWGPVLVLFLSDYAQVLLSLCALRAAFGERLAPGASPCLRRFPLTALAAVPALQLVYVFNFLGSAAADKVKWGGYIYRLEGPYDVTAEKAA